MSEHSVLGREGEEAAARFLVLQGYHIVQRDWRFGHCDIDIIANYRGILVFVEVKTRSSNLYGDPEESVDSDKIRHLLDSANAYMAFEKIQIPVRFDIVSVIKENETYKIRHFRDAFGPEDWTPKKKEPFT